MRVNATDLQNAFGKYLALTEKEDIIVTKNGKDVAKLTRYTGSDYFLLHEEAKQYLIPKRISYEEYQDLVNSSDQRYELIDGEVYLLASPSFNHQLVVNEIAGHFYNFFKGKNCRSLTAPLDVRLFGFATKFEEDPNVVQPDVIVICDVDKVNADNKYEGIPTLIVEVLSPSTKSKDLSIKLNLYMRSGIKEFWIVDVEDKKIMQYSFTEDREIQNLTVLMEKDPVQSVVFERLKIPLSDIFRFI